MTRRTLAFLLAPLWAPFAIFLYVVGGQIPTPGSWLIPALVMAIAFAYGALFFLGLPIYRFLKYKAWTSFHLVFIVGIFLGFSSSYIGVIFLKLLRGPHFFNISVFDLSLDWPFVAIFSGVGALVSCTVWLIDRPDKTSPSPDHT